MKQSHKNVLLWLLFIALLPAFYSGFFEGAEPSMLSVCSAGD